MAAVMVLMPGRHFAATGKPRRLAVEDCRRDDRWMFWGHCRIMNRSSFCVASIFLLNDYIADRWGRVNTGLNLLATLIYDA